MRLARRGIGVMVGLECVAFILIGAVMLDVGAHRRSDPYGINQFGHRGPARIAKLPGERRVVIVGGSAAFDAPTPWPATLGPALIGITGGAFDVQNLAEPRSGPDGYIPTLTAYDYLRPDLVIIYDGYEPAGDRWPGRRASWLFRSTGYLPMLWGPGSRIPGPPRGTPSALADSAGGDPSCTGSFATYCAAMAGTVRHVLAAGRSALVVTPPYVTERHRLQQESLAAEMARQFQDDARFRYLNLGRSAADTPIIARHIAAPASDLLRGRK